MTPENIKSNATPKSQEFLSGSLEDIQKDLENKIVTVYNKDIFAHVDILKYI